MKKVYIITTLILIYLNSMGQGFNWVKELGGGSGGVFPASIAVDASGNVYTVGGFQGTEDFNPGLGVNNLTAIGNSDVYISKIDAFGNFVWIKQIGGALIENALSIKLDLVGNLYVSGGYQGTVDFNPNAGIYNITSVGPRDAFVVKLDVLGNFIWAKSMGGISAYTEPITIAVDAAGNVYTSGHYDDIVDFDPGVTTYYLTPVLTEDIFVSKLDQNGNFVWAKSMGGPGADYGYSMTLDNFGNVFTTGFFQVTADFDPGTGTYTLAAGGNSDIFVSKLDPAGNFVWARKMGGSGHDEIGLDIKIDLIGNVYTAGRFLTVADFDPGPSTFNLTSGGGDDVFISKLDQNGNFVWAKRIGGIGTQRPSSMALDGFNNVYITGYFFNTVDCDPGPGVYNFSAINTDFFLTKLDPSGTFMLASKFGTVSPNYSTRMTIDANDNVYIIGKNAGTVDFDPGIGVYNHTASGYSPTYILKLCQPASISTITANGPLSFCQGGSLVLTASASNSYSWNTTATTQSILVSVSGNYFVTITNTAGCSVTPPITSVSVNPNPTITVVSGSVCAGKSFTIIPNGASTYTVSGGSSIVTPSVNTSYSVSGTNVFGCISQSMAVLNVSVELSPTITAISSMSLICSGQSATLMASGGITYSWSSGGTLATEIVSPITTTNYSVNGFGLNGCDGAAFITQLVSPCTNLGLFENRNEDLKVYPNPLAEILNFETKDGGFIEIQIVNEIGQLVLSHNSFTNKFSCDVKHLQKGIYFVRVKKNNELKVVKMAKE